MSKLFSPLTIKEVTLKNRLVVSPMCQYSSTDGFGNDWHLVHYGSFAVGGAGLVITEATAVSPEGRISPSDLGIWNDSHIDFLKRITAFIESQGSVAGIQLAHAGRKASHLPAWKGGITATEQEGGWIPVGPSAIAFKEGDLIPIALDKNGIDKVIADFKAGALRALKAGFKVVEIHAAHGYLINEFLSPISNKRTDEYGGTFENRIRILLEIVAAVKEVWPVGYPLFVRISATDWVENGWNEDDSVKLSRVLKAAGVDLMDCSSGANVSHAKIPVGPLYQLFLAEKVKQEAGIATGAVGMIRTAQEAARIIEEGKADLVFMAREFLRNANFPIKAAKELGVEVKKPLQYERGW